MGKKILIVEDDYIIQAHLKRILINEGYEILPLVDSVTDALNIIESSAPDLVLIDIKLSRGKSGTELGKLLLAKDTIPYLYITSYYDKLTMEDVKETRPHGFITKPFKPSDIITTVEIVLNNFKYKKVDITRSTEEIENDIPFRIKSVINYINENIGEKIEIETLAHLTKWKKQHFTKVFSQYMGVPPYKFILECKIEKAKHLLVNTDLSIAAVAEELGFSSSANFCTAFKNTVESTPEAFRKKYNANKKLN